MLANGLSTLVGVLLIVQVVSLRAATPSNDIVIADFEGRTYGDWTATGNAFGLGPAQGTLKGQMKVSGYRGKGLVNSFYGGDKSTGTLTSPEFTIQRKFITFLVGGGSYRGKNCINLMVDGKVARTATGPNTKPGGTERLDPAHWDVADLAGKRARIQIVDQVTGVWGHINVDHIVQTDRRPPELLADVKQDISIVKRYLNLPLTTGAAMRRVSFRQDGKLLTSCDIQLADTQPDSYAAIDLGRLKGKKITVQVDRLFDNSSFFGEIQQSDRSVEPAGLYHEVYRPQFHFSPRVNWTNDPNGLVYYEGEYHLFFQHNPYGIPWGNMTWGHAVSPDLVHWTQLASAIEPDRLGTIFSGSAVVDWNNTAGFQTGAEKVIVCMYTSAGGTSLESQGQSFSQSLAYSNDRGRSWTKYAHNPVLPNIIAGNRDPKLIWYAPTKRWILALYKDKHDYGLFSSRDLKNWNPLHDVTMPGSGECPDFFDIPLQGSKDVRKWVLMSAKGDYLIGTFDGRRFTPESGPHPLRWGGNYYAVQTYSDIPAADGRRIQIAWMAGGKYPGMPFNQQMSFPSELMLRTCPEGQRLYRYPVKEIAALRTKTHRWNDVAIPAASEARAADVHAELPIGSIGCVGINKNLLADLKGDFYDIEAVIEPADAKEVTVMIFGQKIAYQAAEKKLSAAGTQITLEPVGGQIKLRILVDRVTIDVFGNDGRVALSYCFLPREGSKPLELAAAGGPAKIVSLEVHELKSAWSAAGAAVTMPR
jgi:fructan beta-fructosidase